MRKRIFLLSPANAGGRRAELVFNEQAQFNLALRLRQQQATLGEVFTFISGLYFRGKMAYSTTFGAPPPGAGAAYIITAAGGLLPPHTPVTLETLRQLASVPIDAADERYRKPLERDARQLAEAAGPECDIVLLGSVASVKYTEPLLAVFGERLLFPSEFVGRGDMSRGGLMLRCAAAGTELEYVAVRHAVVHGKRPPKLPKPALPQR